MESQRVGRDIIELALTHWKEMHFKDSQELGWTIPHKRLLESPAHCTRVGIQLDTSKEVGREMNRGNLRRK